MSISVGQIWITNLGKNDDYPADVFGVSAGSPRFQTKPRSLQHSSRLIFTNFKDQLILSKVFKP
jgi:hypothetical protein